MIIFYTTNVLICCRRGMPADMLDDIELRTVQYQTPCIRSLNRADLEGVEEAIVETDRGTLLVAIQGDRRKPAILTYHDIGLNCEYLQRSYLCIA